MESSRVSTLGWFSWVLEQKLVILPFGTVILNKDKIDIAFPTEQEAIEYIRELEDSTNENYREQ